MKELAALIVKLTALVKVGFHGSVTVHFAGGTPRKMEIKQVEDL